MDRKTLKGIVYKNKFVLENRDYADFVYSTVSWFVRGAHYSDRFLDGPPAFYYWYGNADTYLSSRVVV